MTNLVFIPGIGGSNLKAGDEFLFGAGFANDVAVALPLLMNKLPRLELNTDGTTKEPIQTGGLTGDFYATVARFFEQFGLRVIQCPYDWRFLPDRCAGDVLAKISEEIGYEDFYVIAHSMGGVVLRAMYAAMTEKSRMKRAFLLGVPFKGSWDIVQAFHRDGEFYQLLLNGSAIGRFLSLAGAFNATTLGPILGGTVTYFQAADILDRIIGGCDGVLSLMPYLPHLLEPATWADNPDINPAALVRVDGFRSREATGQLPASTQQFWGTGWPTAVALKTDGTYREVPGDGRCPPLPWNSRLSADLPFDANFVPCIHADLYKHPAINALIAQMIFEQEEDDAAVRKAQAYLKFLNVKTLPVGGPLGNVYVPNSMGPFVELGGERVDTTRTDTSKAKPVLFPRGCPQRTPAGAGPAQSSPVRLPSMQLGGQT